MAFSTDKVIKPVLFDNLNEVFDEKGSMFLAMRRVQWCEEGKEPEREKAKLELRKWRITPEGEERADKGFSFLTEDGPDELTKVLVHNGYGNTKEILKELKERSDFENSVNTLFDSDDNDSGDGEYFDIRTALLDNSIDSEEDEEAER
jgi:hypothetical protein